MRNGVDVSAWQGAVDWVQVREAGIEFAYVRCGYGLSKDVNFLANWHGAKSAGVRVLPYYAIHNRDAAEQLAFLLSLLPTGVRRVILDVELDGTLPMAKDITAGLQAMGYEVGIYTGAWWWDVASNGVDVDWATSTDLLVASYTSQPIMPQLPWTDWKVWQYSNAGHVSGISGNVDLNYFKGDDMDEWFGEATVIQLTEPARIYVGDKLVLTLEPATCSAHNEWSFPVGNEQYPPQDWYDASGHNPPNHYGIDLNLDKAPWGDIERNLGLFVYAIADGEVTYITQNWSGVPMIVVEHEYNGEPLWVRYAHIVPVVNVGDAVTSGQVLGTFANWNTGDHLHLDMCYEEYTREYPGDKTLVDPVPILKDMLDPVIVDLMLARE